jgi:hypothetical protein
VERLFPEAQVSIGADISAFDDEDGTKADLIDGSIGELSMFQAAFGYYARGVTPSTAVLPKGWRKRLAATRGLKPKVREFVTKLIPGK